MDYVQTQQPTGVGISPGNPLPSATTGGVNGSSDTSWYDILNSVAQGLPSIINSITGNSNAVVNNPAAPAYAPPPQKDNTTTYLLIGGVVLAALVIMLFVFKKK